MDKKISLFPYVELILKLPSSPENDFLALLWFFKLGTFLYNTSEKSWNGFEEVARR